MTEMSEPERSKATKSVLTVIVVLLTANLLVLSGVSVYLLNNWKEERRMDRVDQQERNKIIRDLECIRLQRNCP